MTYLIAVILVGIIAFFCFFFLRMRHGFNGELKPIHKKKRTQCPFYGFFLYNGTLMDQEGNQCPLISVGSHSVEPHSVGSHSPCRMEMGQETPNWGKCPIATKEGKNELAEKAISKWIIFPLEFLPENKKSWSGIPFNAWFKYVMEKQ